jgi:hypothetical protein
VEQWFAELTIKLLRRGTYRSVAELEQSIQSWIDTWNQDPRPFVWHKTADEILDAIATYCQRINDSAHWTATVGSRRIVWMIIGMIKAHPMENRMAQVKLPADVVSGVSSRPSAGKVPTLAILVTPRLRSSIGTTTRGSVLVSAAPTMLSTVCLGRAEPSFAVQLPCGRRARTGCPRPDVVRQKEGAI